MSRAQDRKKRCFMDAELLFTSLVLVMKLLNRRVSFLWGRKRRSSYLVRGEGATQFKRRQMHRWRRILVHEVARLKLWSRTKGRWGKWAMLHHGTRETVAVLLLLAIGVNNREEVMWGRSWDTTQQGRRRFQGGRGGRKAHKHELFSGIGHPFDSTRSFSFKSILTCKSD